MEDELPGRQAQDLLAGEGVEVLGEAGGLVLVGAEQHHRPAGPGPDPGGEVGPVDGRQAGDRRRAPARVQGGEQVPELRDPV